MVEAGLAGPNSIGQGLPLRVVRRACSAASYQAGKFARPFAGSGSNR